MREMAPAVGVAEAEAVVRAAALGQVGAVGVAAGVAAEVGAVEPATVSAWGSGAQAGAPRLSASL